MEFVTLTQFELDQTRQLCGLPFCCPGKQPKFKEDSFNISHLVSHSGSQGLDVMLKELMVKIEGTYKKYGLPYFPLVLVPFILLGLGLYQMFHFGDDITHQFYVTRYAIFFGGSAGMFLLLSLLSCYLNSRRSKKVETLIQQYNKKVYPMGFKVEWNYDQIRRRNSDDPVVPLALQVKMLVYMRQMYCQQRGIPFVHPSLPSESPTTVVPIPPSPAIDDAPPPYSAIYDPSKPHPVTLNLNPPKYDDKIIAVPENK